MTMSSDSAAPESALSGTHSAEQRLKAREDFFRLLSHEIRTPLNGLMGMLDLLSNTPLSPDQKSYLGTAADSGAHLLSLVNDFLDYARIDAGHITLEPTDVRLEPLLQGVAELLSPRAFAKGIEIVWSLDSRLLHVRADEGRLRQILFNLAGNAIKFTHTGGVRLHVGLTQNGHVRFSVSDTGEGIPEEARARIFEEFGQVDPIHHTQYGGAGLGLVVVNRLVEAMNGTLTLVSEVGKGSVFSVELQTAYGLNKPVAPSESPRLVTLISDNPVLSVGAEGLVSDSAIRLRTLASLDEVSDPHATLLCDRSALSGPVPARSARSLILLAPEQRDEIDAWRQAGWAGYLIKPLRRQSLLERLNALRESGRRPAMTVNSEEDERVVAESAPDKSVLLVEDNPVNALLAQILLQREGCRVERAASGEEALTLTKDRVFDLILMDLGLPGLDGLGTTRELRARGVSTPIIALTANAYEEDRRASLAAGMNDFLTKPIELTALRTRLHNWVRRDEAA